MIKRYSDGKKITAIVIATFLLCVSVIGVLPFTMKTDVNIAKAENSYKSFYLTDYATGAVLKEENATDRHPIASMVKIMTLNLIFKEIDEGRLTLNDEINVSETAAGMGGSQMFLSANTVYPVSDLIKGIVVCSANDAAVAMGERISGSVEAFVAKMNSYAIELGMNDTLFCNITGLPNSGEQYSTAKDVSIMMKKLLSYEKYYDFSKIWIEDYKHPDGRTTQMVNTNKLVRFMKECDAGKTGFTNEAGFCLSASAKLGETRVIATVLGGSDSKSRFNKVSTELRWALNTYETKKIVSKGEQIPLNAEIENAKRNENVYVIAENDVTRFGKRGDSDEFNVEITYDENLRAPLKANTRIGELKVIDANGEIIGSTGLILSQDIEKKSLWDSIKEIIQNRDFLR